eukprot:67260-Chlamydomonas_euryale.AAC.1
MALLLVRGGGWGEGEVWVRHPAATCAPCSCQTVALKQVSRAKPNALHPGCSKARAASHGAAL